MPVRLFGWFGKRRRQAEPPRPILYHLLDEDDGQCEYHLLNEGEEP